MPAEMAFNVDHLLNTNSTPSEEQRKSLQNVILQLNEAILNNDKAISRIKHKTRGRQAKVLVLQTKRTELIQQRRCYSSLLSPVRCLPFENFGKIFAYAICDRPRHVLNLSAVCQLWRYAALGTPILWSTIELGHHRTIRNLDNYIDSWIERAHSYPLTLVIKKQDGFLDPVYGVRTFIAKHQWKSITLDSDDTSILSIVKELEFSNLEVLESFSLSLRLYFGLSSNFPDALRYAPKLKALNLSLHHDVTFDTLPFPWRQLTSLSMTLSSWGQFYRNINLDILKTCVNLEELIIDGSIDGNYDISGSNDSIALNYLRKLHTRCLRNKFLLFLNTLLFRSLLLIISPTKMASMTTLKKIARPCSNSLSAHITVYFSEVFQTSDLLWSSNSMTNLELLIQWFTRFLGLSWSTRKWNFPPYIFHD